MWVGQTEKAIARAFEQAADERAMLILDEADSLLRDRAGWEVTQVNEMLSWMERHPYPFVCTTNLMDSLDPATLCRFLFKVRFLPMTPARAREAFRRTFAAEPPPALDRLDPLTPGDFALVAHKARVLGERDRRMLAAMLASEVAGSRGQAGNGSGTKGGINAYDIRHEREEVTVAEGSGSRPWRHISCWVGVCSSTRSTWWANQVNGKRIPTSWLSISVKRRC